MSRQELLLSPEGLRIDGRRANELRRISCRASVLSSADGSAYYEQGNTKVLVAVYGPREPRNRAQMQSDRASINVEFNVAPFSTSERRKRSKGDKRLLEIASFVKQTFEGAVQTSVYPRSQIDLYVHLLQNDGGTLEACINAATLALVDAGISMTDYVCACTAGFIDDTPVLDLNFVEESAIECPALTLAVLPRSGCLALLQMESKIHASNVDHVMDLAIEGCKHIHANLDRAVLAAANDLAGKLITIQDGQGAPYFLDKICVKFTSEFNVGRQHKLEATDVSTLLERSIVGHSDSADLPFVTDAGVDKDVIATGDISTWAPWYTLFRQQWISELQVSEHEAFLHPVACVLVASGSEADPVATLRELQRHQMANKV
ncbi:Exosome non-catalytic core component [Coemansia sp. RSA 2559]|nr:Exosome non-catalytic core component [Coemansia sp. RSA 2559]KAJ2854553.1 Exosome non-catalytic core component [Coemansia erecta]